MVIFWFKLNSEEHILDIAGVNNISPLGVEGKGSWGNLGISPMGRSKEVRGEDVLHPSVTPPNTQKVYKVITGTQISPTAQMVTFSLHKTQKEFLTPKSTLHIQPISNP